jgi:hypothetical protein
MVFNKTCVIKDCSPDDGPLALRILLRNAYIAIQSHEMTGSGKSRGRASMNRILLVVGMAAAIGSAAYADETQAPATLSNEQAQARQFGIYFGGTASQYDLCVKKGFLAKGDQSAEDTAKAVLEKMTALSKGPDESAYVQDGWDMMKKEISAHESFYTREKCVSVGKEWAKMLATMAKK